MSQILIIDDDDLMRASMRMVLAEEHHEIREARNGDEGLALMRENAADLVICDIIMPEKDGIETVQILRDEWSALRILAVSGAGRIDPSERLTDAQLLGADATLAKPFSNVELREMVARLLASP
jgi:CheY-like chemotaxis protein